MIDFDGERSPVGRQNWAVGGEEQNKRGERQMWGGNGDGVRTEGRQRTKSR